MEQEQQVAVVSDLERLVAIDEICKLKARYCRFLDCQEWDNLRELFIPDAIVSKPDSPFGDVDSFISWAQEELAGVRTIHHAHLPEIDVVAPDRALGLWSLHTDSERKPADLNRRLGNRYYEEEYRKVDGRWLIASRRLRYVWMDDKPVPFGR